MKYCWPASTTVLVMDYAAAASRGLPPKIAPRSPRVIRGASNHAGLGVDRMDEPKKRSHSPSHIPHTSDPEANVYVLTLMTDRAHHERMTQLRDMYFPKELNRLAAHLTLFHALPGSRLQSHILPHIKAVAEGTAPFQVDVSKPFRMKRGIGISVSQNRGGREGSRVHRQLQQPWFEAGFLSEQDAAGCRLHYTIMNKVNDEQKVDDAFKEVCRRFKEKADVGTVQGFLLWRYNDANGTWQREDKFEFRGAERGKASDDPGGF